MEKKGKEALKDLFKRIELQEDPLLNNDMEKDVRALRDLDEMKIRFNSMYLYTTHHSYGKKIDNF